MASIENIIELETPYPEDKKAFYQYFKDMKLEKFFSHVGNTRYKVPYLMVKSVINEGRKDYKGAKHRYEWKRMSEFLQYKQPNSKYSTMHKQQICKMLIDESRGSYQRLMNLMKKTLDYHIHEDLQFNVVKYVYEDNYSTIGRFVK